MEHDTDGAMNTDQEVERPRTEATVLEGVSVESENDPAEVEVRLAALGVEANETERRFRVFQFSVNGDSYETDKRKLTPDAILELAGCNPDQQYLVEIEPNSRDFKGKGTEPIEMKHCMEFISLRVGPTPTS